MTATNRENEQILFDKQTLSVDASSQTVTLVVGTGEDQEAGSYEVNLLAQFPDALKGCSAILDVEERSSDNSNLDVEGGPDELDPDEEKHPPRFDKTEY